MAGVCLELAMLPLTTTPSAATADDDTGTECTVAAAVNVCSDAAGGDSALSAHKSEDGSANIESADIRTVTYTRSDRCDGAPKCVGDRGADVFAKLIAASSM